MSDTLPLDWTQLVIEARRRRVRDGLTQGTHADLAGVSRDTIRSFDRFEKTITLEKAIAILRVVGLVVDERFGETRGEDFIAGCLARWRTLTEELPAKDSGRFEYGFYFFCYELVGSLSPTLLSSPEVWLKILNSIPSVSGWPPFITLKKRALQPNIINNEIECWLGSPQAQEDKVFVDAPHLDYWKVNPVGALFVLRGYQEDGADSASPGTFLDISLPLWRIGDVVEHARLLVAEVTKRNLGEIAAIRFTARWTGLAGRMLADWADPTRNLAASGRYRCRLNEVRSFAEVPHVALGTYPDETVKSLVRPLYEGFEFIDPDTVELILAERRAKIEREGWGGPRSTGKGSAAKGGGARKSREV